MEPYRSFYPHAGLVLPNTKRVAERVIVLPTGSAMHADAIRGITSIFGILASGAAASAPAGAAADTAAAPAFR